MSNNEEQTQDQKLRAAAENMYNSFSVFSNKNAAPFNEYKRIAFIDGAKSEAAREYWQVQQPKVDLDLLKKKVMHMIPLVVRDVEDTRSAANRIVEALSPHLQPESDAVEFSEWASEEGWEYTPHEKMWHKAERGSNTLAKTGIKLYAEYKQSKTNSYATNNS